ncbi:unnamed protein product [Cyprideis torosa]|uniref:UDP-N-acetylglucosamine 4-epimerase n=1 Tax=Cyprideis torosa TaxID=163714 RepID=A0A7R8WBS4_9CRUS|nr:unnamed protein product [Cyprideis torosa]CAG0887695.1 unnamed protein product [Cyprideis torosa]
MTNKQTVFVTGGAGYIGSHCVLSLLEAGYDVVAIDNFCNSVGHDGKAVSLQRVEELTGKEVEFHQVDLLDIDQLREVFKKYKVDHVIHFAAMKAVGESMEQPFKYYRNNLIGAINLLEVMKENDVRNLVFSSSCTVYGSPKYLPITEEHPTGENITNVYGRTKYIVEQMLQDMTLADKSWNFINLRYFNPVGAHPSGVIGESPTKKKFTNLMPFIGAVAIGREEKLTVFGNDYPTKDGTCIRDYTHIMDLATGHVAAVEKLSKDHVSWRGYNLACGNGFSVLEVVKAFEEVCGRKIPVQFGPRRAFNVDLPELYAASLRSEELGWKAKTYNLGAGKGTSVLELARIFEESTGAKIPIEIKGRREGDIVEMFADTTRVSEELGWKPKFSIAEACADYWRWQTKNPNGYD